MAWMFTLTARANMGPFAVLARLAIVVLEANLLAVVRVSETTLVKNLSIAPRTLTTALSTAPSAAATSALGKGRKVRGEGLVVLQLAHHLLQGLVGDVSGQRGARRGQWCG